MTIFRLVKIVLLLLGVCMSMTACAHWASIKNSRPHPDDLTSWWVNVADYTYMWWAKGLRDESKVFNIQTSRYGLSFDADDLRLGKLGPIANAVSETDALTQDSAPIDLLPDVAFEMALEASGQRYVAQSAGPRSDDFQLIESGKCFQRRWLTNLAFAPGVPRNGTPPALDAVHSGLEIAAWPDRVAFILTLVLIQDIENATLEITFVVPPSYSTLSTYDESYAFINDDGYGFVFLKHTSDEALTCDPSTMTCTVRHEIESTWRAGGHAAVGLIIYPTVAAKQVLTDAVVAETSPLDVRAVQVQPESSELNVRYDRGQGWYYVGLRNDGDIASYAESSNDRIEQVTVTIHNPDPHPRTVRLNFGKEGQVFGITGISAILRDAEHNPLGVPVQLSKNWHTSSADVNLRAPFEGPWYHGLTMLTVPSEQTVTFEYVSINALWGQLPAASHAQLSLVGWGSNQLWDQAAIGSWGESLCFEPDQGQTGGAVLDSRPLMVWGMGKEPQKKWSWTNNVGGADFLVYYDHNAEKQANSRMKTMVRRNGPNLTEVTYAGTSYDQKIDLEYTVSLYRTDDITRGVYRLRYDIREKVEFSKLVLFQCGSYDYSYTGERKFAFGNEEGLVKEWETQWGGFIYRTDRMELTGEIPWVSMHEAVKRGTDFGAWANRGIVVRRWDARLGGQEAAPWIAEIGAPVRSEDTSLVDFLPPPGVTELLPGDYVEAEIVHVIMPQFAADYYGPNQNLRQALLTAENTWKMIYREAVGNHLDVRVSKGGKLMRSYPILIRSQGSAVAFTVTGGLGYVPVTISDLNDYRGFKLEHKVDGIWIELDQSHYGKDFWQTDFNSTTQRWELTYSLPLDTPQDESQTHEFRLIQTDL